MVVGTHNMSVVKGTTSGTRSLLLLLWDLCITLSTTSFSGLQKFGASSVQRQWERYWSWFQYFFLHVFFLALLLVNLLESSSEIPPPALNCSHIQHLEGVFMWLVMQLCQAEARICLWPIQKLRGKVVDAGVERDPQGWCQQLERCQQTPKHSRVLGHEQRLSINLSSLKASCYLVCLLLGRFPQQMNRIVKRKQRLLVLGHSHYGKNRRERTIWWWTIWGWNRRSLGSNESGHSSKWSFVSPWHRTSLKWTDPYFR